MNMFPNIICRVLIMIYHHSNDKSKTKCEMDTTESYFTNPLNFFKGLLPIILKKGIMVHLNNILIFQYFFSGLHFKNL